MCISSRDDEPRRANVLGGRLQHGARENNGIPELPQKRLPGTQAYAKLRGRKNKTFVKEDPKELSSGKTLSLKNCRQVSLNHCEPRHIPHERRQYVY